MMKQSANARAPNSTRGKEPIYHAEVAARIEDFIGQALSVREMAGNDTRPVRAALKAAFAMNRD